MGEDGGYDYTYRYTVTTRMTPALRWAAMRASGGGSEVMLNVLRCQLTY